MASRHIFIDFPPVCGPLDGPVKETTPLINFLQRVQAFCAADPGPEGVRPQAVRRIRRPPRSPGNGTIPAAALNRFLGVYFSAPEADLVYAEPADFVPEPKGFLPKVKNPAVRAWALEVHALWKNLSRRCRRREGSPGAPHLAATARTYHHPGSRFREVYYWDSYWIIRGLLASKMHETAKAIVNNLIYLVETYGHVLNGARAYYTNRSQPPLLSSMILEIFEKTGDLQFVKRSFPSLLKEHDFWSSGCSGCSHKVNRYYAMWNKPRPRDEESGSKLVDGREKEAFYREVASTAESGWDFSSRWMSNSSDLTTLATTSIIPVDLNVYILKMELDIAFFAKLLGDVQTKNKFLAAAHSRRETLKSVFWNDEMGQWLDYRLKDDKCEDGQEWDARNQNRNIFASNFVPLWIMCNSDHSMVEKATKSFKTSGLLQPFGIATSLTNSGQQWDFPNGWAPLQHLIVEGLARSGLKEAQDLAEDIATRWIRTNIVSYRESGVMHEKYDVRACGEFGGGGEYTPQTGFGWSNGVVLAFLEEFGWPQDREFTCK
ncbi:unnamed protein product [Spirodela intermedia]|uniref:Trehalase n=1 Tax=Spirodela intermedia TaxID=51605 RepID=A0A7I8IGB6_SPIIN|nr:unnamed protein product [Spirodela intermedia]CAA6656334.1 unnamed protein product [Spirodela intermedia]